jgi:hypothetical protein
VSLHPHHRKRGVGGGFRVKSSPETDLDRAPFGVFDRHDFFGVSPSVGVFEDEPLPVLFRAASS